MACTKIVVCVGVGVCLSTVQYTDVVCIVHALAVTAYGNKVLSKVERIRTSRTGINKFNKRHIRGSTLHYRNDQGGASCAHACRTRVLESEKTPRARRSSPFTNHVVRSKSL